MINLLLRSLLTWDILTAVAQADIACEDRFVYFEKNTSTVWLNGSWVMEYGLRRAIDGSANINPRSFRLGDKFLPHEPMPVFADKDKLT